MSIEAITWALNLAPVPMDEGTGKRKDPKPNSACAFVLVALANHADPDGTNAFPGVDTIVRYTRLSERTVRTSLDRLEDLGVITPCDPAVIAAKIKRADRRPKGYDLDFNQMREDLTDQQLEKIAKDNPWLRPWIEQFRSQRGAIVAPRDGVQPLHLVERGATDDSHGVQPPQSRGAAVAPEPSLEPSLEPSYGTHAADAAPPEQNGLFPEDQTPADVQADPKPQTKATSRTKGTRIPDDFEVTPAMTAWATENGYGHLDLKAITEEFFDYWIAKPGRDGVKLDWVATWRNWIRRDERFRPGAQKPVSGQPRKTSEDFLWGQASQRRSAR